MFNQKMTIKRKKVVIAMSGGVDSSVAAYLLKLEGYEIIGITMKTWGYDDIPEKDSGCCSLEMIYNARNVANQLDFPHYTVDFTGKFHETVISDFITEYLKGKTPNPCVLCNKVIKWGELLDKAASLGAEFIATGHYAKIKADHGRFFISAANDKIKDQSYALWRLPQKSLEKTIFPLGELTKTEVRKIASDMGMKPAETPDSQEICFVPNDDYRQLLRIRLPEIDNKLRGGKIIYHGETVGHHDGYINYTIGQRRGLKLSLGKAVYVSKIDPENNIVFVDDENGLYKTEFICNEINLQKLSAIREPVNALVKIRYNDPGAEAVLEPVDGGIKVISGSPRKAVTPGQSAVFYSGDDIIGGGIIDLIVN